MNRCGSVKRNRISVPKEAEALEKEYVLTSSGVDEVSMALDIWMKQAGITSSNAVRLRLVMEEMLLRISAHYEGNVTAVLRTRKRFGTPTLRLRYEGEPYDPTRLEESEEDETTRQILSHIQMMPEWSYRSGTNELVLRGPRKTLRSELWMLIAVAAAVVCGLLGDALSEGLRTGLLNFVLNPVSDAFMNALNTFIGIMVFLSLISGICSIGNLADFSKTGKYVVTRMLLSTALGMAASIILLVLFFRLPFGTAVSGESQAETIVALLFSIIPSDPVSPFANGDMLQIIFLALFTGAGLLVLEKKTEMIREFVEQSSQLFLEIIGVICSLLPLYIFLSLTVFLWENGMGVFIKLLKPLLAVTLVSFLLFAEKVIVTSLKLHVPVWKLVNAVRKTMLSGFLTASSAATYGQIVDVNENKLGISKDFNQFALPLSMLIESSTIGVSFAGIIFYLAEIYGASINFNWLFTAWLLCTVFAIASPPVSGGTLISLGIILTQLNLPGEGLAIAGILAIINDFITTGFKIGISSLEIMQEAKHLDKLNPDVVL